ncbi:MAG: hypothetical protein WKF90_16645 [Pyrinomonadaceae bacterium]
METDDQIGLSFKKLICSHFEGWNALEMAEQYCGDAFVSFAGLGLTEIDMSLFPKNKSAPEVLAQLYEEDNDHLLYIAARLLQSGELDMEYIDSGNVLDEMEETGDYDPSIDPYTAYHDLEDYFVYSLETKNDSAVFRKSNKDISACRFE